MEFTAYLDTKKDYEPSDVVCAFHMVLERGLHAMEEKREQFHANIIKDIINSIPIIERE